MRFLIYLLVLSPLILFAGKKEHRRIELYNNFTSDPKDSGVVNGYLGEAKNVLNDENIEVVPSDLSGNLKSDEIFYVVLWNIPNGMKEPFLKKIPKQKALLFMWEPPTVLKNMYSEDSLKHFRRIYTWDDDLVDNKRFFKFYYPVLKPMIDNIPSFEEKKLLSFMFTNRKSKHPKQLYTERANVVNFFEDNHPGDFEFYGKAWEKKKYKNHRGAPHDKIETLKNYRFTICYENMTDVKGYVTEKIFDAFASGCVPVYLGATNVTDYIPKNCFIDRREFKNNEELYQFLKKMDKETYDKYLENIRQFLKSDKAQLFSWSMFQVIFLEAVRFP